MSDISKSEPHLARVPGSAPSAGNYWLWVLCLLGLDYFSTLAYQPSITFEVAGLLGPLATAVVVLVTLTCALPLYWYLAGRSPSGTGSIGLLERVVHGWRGKTLVLLLLGFAAADFTMLKTISLADAAVHILKNDNAQWQGLLERARTELGGHAENLGIRSALVNQQVLVTILLGVLGFLFWSVLRRGFNRKVLFLAVPLVGVYMLMNGMLIAGGLAAIAQRPELLTGWLEHVQAGEWEVRSVFWSREGWVGVALVSFLFLPNLALGLSGFELSLMLMPQVRGSGRDDPANPTTRIRNTRKVLFCAAFIMSIFLLGAVFVTCLLVPPAQMQTGGRAANRALAYMAHGEALTVSDADMVLPFCGHLFGSLYDIVTVLVLCLTGTSVMTALNVLLPQFLLRFGMQLKWAQRWGALLLAFAGINLAVTLYFRASVLDQRGAYATAVLVLMTCAGAVTFLDKRHAARKKSGTPKGRLSRRIGVLYFRLVALGLALATVIVVVRSPNGLGIAGLFIGVLLAMSVVSRALRVDELRTAGFLFKDDKSKFLWDSLRLADFPILVPHRPGRHEREMKETQIRNDHNLAGDADIVFLEIDVDDPSDFFQTLLIEACQEDRRFVIKVTQCVSAAHAIAAIALEMSRASKPPALHFGWSEMNLLTASWSYLAFGEGNIPWKVRELIVHAEPDPDKQPRVVIG